MDTFKVYIFSQESRAAVYGVGTYLALLCKILKKQNRIRFSKSLWIRFWCQENPRERLYSNKHTFHKEYK